MKDYLYKIDFLSIDRSDKYNKVKKEILDCLREKNILRPLVKFNDKKTKIYLGYNKYEIKNIFRNSSISNYKLFTGVIIDGTVISQSKLFRENIQKLDLDSNEYLKANNIEYSKNKIPSSISNCTPSQIATKLLETNKGICIGESHDSLSSKSFFIDNMEILKKNNVKTIFLEHLIDEHHSEDLSKYFAAPNNAEMPFRLKLYLETLDSGYHTDKTYNFQNLVKEAKKHQIKVVAFDTNASYFTFNPNKLFNDKELQNRYRRMNYLAAKKINSFSEDGKWIALIGSGHLTKNLGVPGVADLTNTPSIVIQDIEKGYSVNVANGKVNYLNSDVKPDIIISMHTRNRDTLRLNENLLMKTARNIERKDSSLNMNFPVN